MVYITGDIHGEALRIVAYGNEYGLTSQDYLLVAGDFGCIFGSVMDELRLDTLEDLPFTILFIDGNHECFPKIMAYPEEIWSGGRVHRIRKNIVHLMRGQVFDIEGSSIFTMGGGCSLDKYRRIPGLSWWPEEMPSDDEYEEAWKNLNEHNNSVDIIISHAAPETAMHFFEQTGVITKRYPDEAKLNLFLERVRETVNHRYFYFGHMHVDKHLSLNQIALYYDVYHLETAQKAIPILEDEDND